MTNVEAREKIDALQEIITGQRINLQDEALEYLSDIWGYLYPKEAKINKLKTNKLEEYCLSRDISFSITWTKTSGWSCKVLNRYGLSFSFFTDGHKTKKKAINKMIKKIKKYEKGNK